MININYSSDNYYNYNNQTSLSRINNPLTLEERKNANQAVKEANLDKKIQEQRREDQRIETNKEYVVKEQSIQKTKEDTNKIQNSVSDRKALEEKSMKMYEELQKEQKENMITQNKYRNNSYYQQGSIFSDYA